MKNDGDRPHHVRGSSGISAHKFLFKIPRCIDLNHLPVERKLFDICLVCDWLLLGLLPSSSVRRESYASLDCEIEKSVYPFDGSLSEDTIYSIRRRRMYLILPLRCVHEDERKCKHEDGTYAGEQESLDILDRDIVHYKGYQYHERESKK